MEFPWQKRVRWYCPSCFDAFIAGCGIDLTAPYAVENLATGEITRVHPGARASIN
jgi:hypothetical protein